MLYIVYTNVIQRAGSCRPSNLLPMLYSVLNELVTLASGGEEMHSLPYERKMFKAVKSVLQKSLETFQDPLLVATYCTES